MIRLEIIGHLGRDAEVKTVGSTQLISFSMSHTEKYTDGAGQKQERTTWVDCTKWVPQGGSTAVAQYLTKGAQVYVAGAPDSRAWLGKDPNPDGTPAYKSGITLKVFEIQLLSSKQEGQASSQPAAAPPPPPQPVWDAKQNTWIKPEWNAQSGQWLFPGQPAAPKSKDEEELPF